MLTSVMAVFLSKKIMQKATSEGAFNGDSKRSRRHHESQWNCPSSVEPVRAFTLEEPPWITVVTSSK